MQDLAKFVAGADTGDMQQIDVNNKVLQIFRARFFFLNHFSHHNLMHLETVYGTF